MGNSKLLVCEAKEITSERSVLQMKLHLSQVAHKFRSKSLIWYSLFPCSPKTVESIVEELADVFSYNVLAGI